MKQFRILIIEDDPAVAEGLKDGLEREGYAVVWKANGADGIDYAKEHTLHLIVLDVRLPDGSGFDVCRQMRGLRMKQPILMLTARRDEVDKVVGLEMGADDYVTKPFSLQELRSRIRALIRRAYGEFSNSDENADTLFAGDIVIDRTGGRVMRGDQELNLTPTEMRLLTLFVKHAGQVLSRRQILEAVWANSADIESERTVNVHIRRLREKIEIDPSQPALLLTVPGMGYRLSVQ